MMKYLVSPLLLFFMHFGALAQDTLLPTERSSILLHSGKKIYNATLSKINADELSYMKRGKMFDVSTNKIQYIESRNYRIDFDGNMKMDIRKYDVILNKRGDSIRGFIKAIEPKYLSYIPKGKPYQKPKIRKYKSYILNNGDIMVRNGLFLEAKLKTNRQENLPNYLVYAYAVVATPFIFFWVSQEFFSW